MLSWSDPVKRIFVGLAILLSVHVAAADESGVHVETLSKTGSSWDGNLLPDYPEGNPEITILRISIPPGAVLPLHRHPVINGGVLLRGELTVITESGRTLCLKAGEAIIEVVSTWHYGKNDGSETAEIIVFYAGVRGEPITVKQETGGKALPKR